MTDSADTDLELRLSLDEGWYIPLVCAKLLPEAVLGSPLLSFRLLGVAGAVLKPFDGLLPVLVPFVASRRDGAVRIVPSLPLPLREEAESDMRERLRGVTGVLLEEASSSISVSASMLGVATSRLSRIVGSREVMMRRISANSLISSRKSDSVRVSEEKRACS